MLHDPITFALVAFPAWILIEGIIRHVKGK